MPTFKFACKHGPSDLATAARAPCRTQAYLASGLTVILNIKTTDLLSDISTARYRLDKSNATTNQLQPVLQGAAGRRSGERDASPDYVPAAGGARRRGRGTKRSACRAEDALARCAHLPLLLGSLCA